MKDIFWYFPTYMYRNCPMFFKHRRIFQHLTTCIERHSTMCSHTGSAIVQATHSSLYHLVTQCSQEKLKIINEKNGPLPNFCPWKQCFLFTFFWEAYAVYRLQYARIINEQK
jgi:hypothetical protein